MAGQNATAILVAGMHRCGTSALAGVLGKLGVPLGERLLEPGGDNPKGYWEHQDIVAVHERLLAALGSRWDDVRALPSGWLASDPARQAAAAIDGLVTRDFAENSLWAVKDPRLCRLLPLWFEVLDRKNIRPVVLFMARKPSEAAASIEARNHWLGPIGEMLWLRYIAEVEAASRDVPRAVVIYEDLLAEPGSTVASALRVLGVELAPLSAQTRDGMAGFIDKHGRHHTHDSNRKPREKFASIAEAIYESLVSIARGKDAWTLLRKGVAEFEQYWQREGEPIDAMAGMAMRLAADAESERIENKLLESKLTAQIHWSEEAQANREALQAEIAGLKSKLTAQVQWSEEAQADREALRMDNVELKSSLAAQTRSSEEARALCDSLRMDNDDLQAKLRSSANERDLAAADLKNTKRQLALLEAEIGSVYDSTSWKFTKPLRAVARKFRSKAERISKQDKGRP